MPKTKPTTSTPTKLDAPLIFTTAQLAWTGELTSAGTIYARALLDAAKKAKLDPIAILTEEPNAKVDRVIKKTPNMQFILGWFRAIQDATGRKPADVLEWFAPTTMRGAP